MLSLLMSVSCGQYHQSITEATADYDESNADYDDKKLGHVTPRSYESGSSRSQRPIESSPKPTPVAILKQINRHNEDGSYTYGFEGGDGSFKIETKLPNGEVKGKYGFVDDAGKVRVVEYGANQNGFQPAGEGITVAPPTLIDETTNKDVLQSQNFQDYDYGGQQTQQTVPINSGQQRSSSPPLITQHSIQPQQESQQFDHTQAIYPRESMLSFVNRPIFAPAIQPNAPQSQLIKQNLDSIPPASQAHSQGPVQFNPAPVHELKSHQVQSASGPAHRSNNPRSGGILDQLARDYALPQGGSPPLHDISFGYY
ncbi:hypothetical protein PV327_008783 [Microctonus hyperodae]|uniref:Uncharacterized protein n=1 Tax=Microctonus hyperodae TaxID=165561 RepID=A0AA39KV26_MICHY|nr:hypothetical protein PV327_008783 [Microctonus hyperodae]